MTDEQNVKNVAKEIDDISIDASKRKGTPQQLWTRAWNAVADIKNPDIQSDADSEFNETIVHGTPAKQKTLGLTPGAVYRLDDDGYTRDDDIDLADDLDEFEDFVKTLA